MRVEALNYRSIEGKLPPRATNFGRATSIVFRVRFTEFLWVHGLKLVVVNPAYTQRPLRGREKDGADPRIGADAVHARTRFEGVSQFCLQGCSCARTGPLAEGAARARGFGDGQRKCHGEGWVERD